MENYLSQQRVHVFSNVGVLIYVFDIESRDTERDLATYVSIITALLQYSPTAKIYVLIHKMDLIVPGKREEEFVELLNLVRAKTPRRSAIVAAAPPPPSLQQPMSGDSPYQSTGQLQLPAEHGQQQLSDEITITPFATSIWDQSLYKAWASIIHDLVPNLGLIEESLGSLGRLIEAEELLLYERTSFLVVSHWTSEEGALNPIDDRFERMSNILKHFKHSISKYTETPKNAEQLVLLEYKAGLRFAYFFIKFTANTYLQVVLPPGEARFNAAKVNCQIAAEQFKFFDGPHVSNPTMGPS